MRTQILKGLAHCFPCPSWSKHKLGPGACRAQRVPGEKTVSVLAVLEEGQTPAKPLTRKRGKWRDTGGQGGGYCQGGGWRGRQWEVGREACVFCFCSVAMPSGPVPLPVTSPVPLHTVCVHFQPEGPGIKLFEAQVLFSTCVPGTWGAQL